MIPMPGRMQTILLVDDEPLYRTSTAALLRNSGYQVISAASTHEAIRLMREQPAGLAMVDLNLPGCHVRDGTESSSDTDSPHETFAVGLTAPPPPQPNPRKSRSAPQLKHRHRKLVDNRARAP